METSRKPSTQPQVNKGGDNDFVLAFGNIAIDERGSRTLIRPQEITKPSPPGIKTVNAPLPPSSLKNLQNPSFQEPTKPNVTKPSSPEARTVKAPPPPLKNLQTPSFQEPTKPNIIKSSPPEARTVDAPASPSFKTPQTPSFQEPVKPNRQPAAPVYVNLNDFHHAGNPGYGPPVPPPANPSPGLELLQIVTTQDGSEDLLKILKQGKFIRETFDMLFPNLITLMADKFGQRVFDVLLNLCSVEDLYAILQLFNIEREAFLRATLCETGSRSIQGFIRRLKNTGLEKSFTNFLAEFARPGFMCHKIASHVVRKCFVFLGDEANQILYDCVAMHFHPLATNDVGCVTVNDAIDAVRGTKRFNLLSLVVVNALPLSLDAWGNYVVQHVLDLKNEVVSREICMALKGGFVEVAQKKGGSRIAEKCLKSDYGRVAVMNEIFKDENTLLMLAKDGFGNYVVQSALKVLMMHDPQAYKKLAQILKPRHPKLIQRAEEGDIKSMLKCLS